MDLEEEMQERPDQAQELRLTIEEIHFGINGTVARPGASYSKGGQ